MKGFFLSPAGLALCALVLVNLVTFLLYGADKWKAKHDRWRVPERTLFLFPLLGGSVGAMAGMRVFHHKTKHWYFRFGIPAIFLAQCGLCAFIWYYVNYIR